MVGSKVEREDTSNRLLKVGELAKRAGVLPSTVRYYTLQGLLSPAGHTQGGYALYDEVESLKRFRRIGELRDQRYTIEEIKDKLCDTG